MSDRLQPRNAKEVEQAVAWALGDGRRLEIVGAGSKRGIGHQPPTDVTLDLSGLSGITLYEPEELVLTAHVGTPLGVVEAALAERGQQLAFEPVDLGPVLGAPAGMATLGGVVAANIAGPRRVKAGAARDHFLGFSAVSGRGETFKSGGRVVKNVTGYDLSKLLAGSWGTLAVMSEVTLKVLPAGETQASVLVAGLDDAAAARAMSAAVGSSCEVSAAAHLPAPVALRREAVTVLRLEGFAPSVAYRVEKLRTLLSTHGPVSQIAAEASRDLWRDIGNLQAFTGDISRPLWRICVAPGDGHKVMRRIMAAGEARYFYDWGGGLIWLEYGDAQDARADVVRGALTGLGGHAMLLRAAPALRARIPVFQPQPGPLAALSARLKTSFDPNGILNPGRMTGDV